MKNYILVIILGVLQISLFSQKDSLALLQHKFIPKTYFGEMNFEGLNGRRLIKLSKPKVDSCSSQEGIFKYEFVIDSDGNVISVKVIKTLTKNHLENADLISFYALENAGIESIKKWKFSKVVDNKNQTCYVSITFKTK